MAHAQHRIQVTPLLWIVWCFSLIFWAPMYAFVGSNSERCVAYVGGSHEQLWTWFQPSYRSSGSV